MWLTGLSPGLTLCGCLGAKRQLTNPSTITLNPFLATTHGCHLDPSFWPFQLPFTFCLWLASYFSFWFRSLLCVTLKRYFFCDPVGHERVMGSADQRLPARTLLLFVWWIARVCVYPAHVHPTEITGEECCIIVAFSREKWICRGRRWDPWCWTNQETVGTCCL